MNSSNTQKAPITSSLRPAGLTLLVGTLMLAPLACAPEGPSKNPNNSVIVVSQNPSSAEPETITVDSAVDAEIVVDLPFNAGTGYSWSMPAHSEGVELVGKPKTKAMAGNLPGGPMVATFILKITAPGRQTARLELARAWETDTPAARTVDVVIIAKEAS